MKNIALFICIIFLSGCATVGKPIQQTNVDKIQKGKTTKNEVINILGQPDGSYFEKDNKLVFYYYSSKVKSSAWNFIPLVNIFHNEMNIKNQMLSIVFSKDEIVEEYSFVNSNKPLKYGIIP